MRPAPSSLARYAVVPLALTVTVAAAISQVVAVGSSLRALGASSRAASGPADSPAPAAEAPWKTERAPEWTMSVPPNWTRSTQDVDVVAFDSSGERPNPIMARMYSSDATYLSTSGDVRAAVMSRSRGMTRVIMQREVVVNGVAWFEIEWFSPGQVPLRGVMRGGLSGGRLWRIDCAGADIVFDQIRPTCLRVFGSLHFASAPPLAAPAGSAPVAPAAPATSATVGAPNFSGSWSTRFSDGGAGSSRSRLSLTQAGTSLVGRYRERGDSGSVSGTVHGATANGTWRDRAGSRGNFTWTLTPDGSRFSGSWNTGPGTRSASWSGSREP